ncbi:MAG: 2-oxoacid:acceptor oxidoreductase family protein [Gemmatimonadota bacterium]
MTSPKSNEGQKSFKYPGTPEAMDGSEAVVWCETHASEAAGAYPITPSTQMGEGWAMAVAAGHTNVNGRRLLFFEPEGEHAAAAVTAGMSMVGLRATNFSSGQGIAYMHESLYAAVGKRLTYVLNVAARAMTKQGLNIHAGHDDYHAVDDTGFFQLFGKNVQEVADLNLIGHRVAELSLNPAIVAQDGFLTSHVIESIRLPERELIKEFLGDPADIIESPTPAQRMVFGEKRRRIPEMYDLDYPAMIGVVQNQDSYAQGVAAQRPFYFDHVAGLTDQAMEEYYELTGRRYTRATGYLMDDAEYVLLGQGSVVSNCEAVADHLRTQGLKVGVLNLTMFRPFPADLITRLLKGKNGVAVLERLDQPLAVDPPLLREIRAAMGKGVENFRSSGSTTPYAGVAEIRPDEVPDFYSGCFGMGSRDLQPGDLIAAVNNMLPDGKKQRLYYLGLDFIRKGTQYPKLQLWQEELLESYPHLADLTLEPTGILDLMPKGAISIRIHSIGGWGAITTGKNLAMTAFELAGLEIQANPKYGSEKKGQPTSFYATLAHGKIQLNGELQFVDVVLAPDPNVYKSTNPLAGMKEGGTLIIQSEMTPEELWDSLPAGGQETIRRKNIRVYGVDGFKIAAEEAGNPDLRYRMQGAAFMGAFFKASRLLEQENLTEETLFAGILDQMNKKFGKLGQAVVEDNVRVIRRGYDELFEVPVATAVKEVIGAEGGVGAIPSFLDAGNQQWGIGNQGRFWEQVCSFCASTGQDGIADPFAAISTIPASTSVVRDMTNIRFEVPDFIAEKCTGCSQCWVQCPDAAIPGVVNTTEQVLDAAILTAMNGNTLDQFMSISKNVAKEAHKLLKGVPFHNFADILSQAYKTILDKLGWDAERRAAVDKQFAAVYSVVADFPLAKTTPFFDLPENKEKGTGGLLSITVNPEACKGCNICVEVCPEHALITVKQDEEIVDKLRRNWKMWERLPDTDNRYVNISDLEHGIGILPTLLLKKANYRTMAGGDGACMGCGEKTAVHLLVSTIEGLMQPRVETLVKKLDTLVSNLDQKIRTLLAADADLDLDTVVKGGHAELAIDPEKEVLIQRYHKSMKELKELRWRYTEGPGGTGRSRMAMTNSTGCSSVWGSTYPYNPYPFPWVNHLFQDAPSIAIGIFEGHMRKMGDNFMAVRKAELLVNDEYDEAVHEEAFVQFDWRQFTDEEFNLCPPILAMGGDGAMLDIGFQNVSRLLASGKPIRVVVLDTQVYSNTGGQACTSGFTGQVADMSAYGTAQHGKEETRKEMALIALAHRGAFVLQTSQASPAHMIAGIIKGLNYKGPAVFNLYTPCPVEHGLADELSPHAARLALESRAFPFMIYDPTAGDSWAECVDLNGNPEIDEDWPTYELRYTDADGAEQLLELPLTIADWAATENRFKKHFKKLKRDDRNDDQVPFHELVKLALEDRVGKTPFINLLGSDGSLDRMACSIEMVALAEDRLLFWDQLRELAGYKVAPAVRDQIAYQMEDDFEQKAAEIRAEYEGKIAELKATYPQIIARRLAEGLIRSSSGGRDTVGDILSRAASTPGLSPITLTPEAEALVSAPTGAPAAARPAAAAPTAAAPGAVAAAPATEEDDGDLVLEPYIETARCTTCNECTNLNKKMFAYNENKQAYFKDVKAGTFAEIVQAAERCTAKIIHPGTPLNPRERDLEKWIERAKPFNG